MDGGSPDGQELPRWAWLWFPPLLLVPLYAARVLDPVLYRRVFVGELGLVELATPGIALLGAGFGIAALRRSARLPGPPMRAWLLLVTLGCVYFAGEELSWGQHLVGWQTPASLDGLNDQGETNIHNVSSWFDQKPRLLLELWVLVGGVVLGSRRWLFGARHAGWFWPSPLCLPCAALAILVRVPERLKKWLDLEALPYEIRFSEVQEYYFALFLALYLAALARRLRSA